MTYQSTQSKPTRAKTTKGRSKIKAVVIRTAIFLSVIASVFGLLTYRDTLFEKATYVLAATGADTVPVRVLEAQSYRLDVPAQGEIVGMETVPISTPRTPSGSLRIAWLIPEGSFVRAGQVVLRFDNTDAMLNLEQQEKALDSNQERTKILSGQHSTDDKVSAIDRALAESEYEYAMHVLPEDETIFSQWDIIEANIDADSAKDRIDFLANKDRIEKQAARAEQQILAIERNQVQTEIDIAAQTLNALEIKAPVDGLAVYRRDREREPQVGDQCWSGQVLVELMDLSKLQARVYVLERDAGALAKNKDVLLHLDGIPGKVFHGTINSVSGMAQPLDTNSPLKYFTCQVQIHDFEEDVDGAKPGMTLKADIILDEYESCFVVPASAVTRKRNESLVYVLDGDTFISRPVELGASTHGMSTILEGVEEGEIIALSNPFQTQKTYLPDFSKGVTESNSPIQSGGAGMRGGPR